MLVYIAALFIMAKSGNNVHHVGARLNKVWHIQTVEYYWQYKRNGVLQRGGAFKRLCWLREAHRKHHVLYDSIYVQCLEKAQPDRKEISVAWGWR